MNEITGIIEVRKNENHQIVRLEKLTQIIKELENEEFIMSVKLGGEENAKQ
ncbi:MAG: hypothetical protein PHD70_07440 [Anaerostipes sp.]|nr:hypothetical protein [Anaerostipes sp.]MDD3746286.1 hypothetical protein [Anaerostipes sp.]